MLDVLLESRDGCEEALRAVQTALHEEQNEVARRELMVTWNRLAERLESIQNQINRELMNQRRIR